MLLQKFVGWRGVKPTVEAVDKTLDSVAPHILNIASALLGLIFIACIVRAVAQHQSGDQGGQDAIRKVVVLLLGSILLLQLIRIIFFD